MEIRLLKSFVEVINLASLTKAAKNLHMSQPSITTHIKLLEKELNEVLIKRKAKKIIPTKRGSEVYEYALKVIELENTYKFKWSDEYKNTIMVGASSITGTYLLPELINAYHAIKPKVNFNIRIADSKEIVQYMKDEIVDVGLISNEYHDKTTFGNVFCKDKLIAITPNNQYYKNLNLEYNSTNNKKQIIETLLHSPIISREEGSGTRDSFAAFVRHIGKDYNLLNFSAFVDNNESLIQFVIAGIGIAFIPKIVKKSIKNINDVIIFEIDDDYSETIFSVIYNYNHIEDKPLTFEFIDMVKGYYAMENFNGNE